MDIIVVNSSDVWVRDNNEGKISKGLDPVCEAYGKEREGEIRGGVESVCGEGWAAVTGMDSTKSAAVGARKYCDKVQTEPDPTKSANGVAVRRVERLDHYQYWLIEAASLAGSLASELQL